MAEELTRFQNVCRKHRWKCTPQRLAVYAFMSGNLTHPSVDEVWAAARQTIPTITRESVYRILNEFAAAGLLCRMDKIESAHYDARTTPHGHLVCEKCGQVTDFDLPSPPVLPEGLSLERIRHVEVRVAWLCPECARKN